MTLLNVWTNLSRVEEAETTSTLAPMPLQPSLEEWMHYRTAGICVNRKMNLMPELIATKKTNHTKGDQLEMGTEPVYPVRKASKEDRAKHTESSENVEGEISKKQKGK